MNKNVIVITGPTASGKSDFALKLSDMAEIEIISADSRQIYKYLNIGTAKPSDLELQKVQHHLVDYLEPDEDFSAGKFATAATQVIDDIITRGKIPVVVGGTGFYIKALFEGLSDVNEFDSDETEKVRAELDKILREKGKDFIYSMLLEVDYESAARYNDKNPRRLIRALEYNRLTGAKLSDTFGTENPSNLIPIYYVINPPRQELYKRINDRTELMFRNGLLKETVSIIERGFSPDLNSLNTVGYKECISLIFGEIPPERAIELTKQNTRRYAKRQVTWMNQIKNYREIARPSNLILEEMLNSYHITEKK